MRIVVCAKQVLDPDAVNNYALVGKLVIGEDGKSLTQASIPRLMNAYDEQAIEAALLMRDAGQDVRLTVVTIGDEVDDMLKHAAALGADEIARVDVDASTLDHNGVACLLAAYIGSIGGADLVLCGRQASDDDQGLVPGMLGELLSAPTVTIARSVEANGASVKVVRVAPDGDETVEAAMPVVVTISNEVGEPRYPTMKAKMQARKREPTVVTVESLDIPSDELVPSVVLVRQFVPEVSGHCEMIEGGSAAEQAGALLDKLRGENII
ncbi:MAG: electron transfer flavoprotein subunit beta/FixA family protein [Myxococcales bacterium]|jgi:electron transfer flavoprotein beta subunit|nr:MAG: electron transfer flavoprotein subunit beta/FixA family protein [Myxococcales bacterium]